MMVYRHHLKRIFDLVVAVSALVVLTPLIALLALLVRLKLGSPVFFCQTRPGLHGRPFAMIKFRTMTNACDAQGNLLTDQERLTGFGRLLRSTSLDELPELVNVVKGEMSLVGPRPLLMRYLERYSAHHLRRHEVRPGITGWAQVNGRNLLSWEERFTLDVWYVDHLSFALDLKVLWATIFRVASRKGISQDGHATMEEFRGIQQ